MPRTNASLEGALFVPLYVTPKSLPYALNIDFKDDKSHGSASSLSFLKLQGKESECKVLGTFHCLLTKSNSDPLIFHQATSGYKIVYDWYDEFSGDVPSHLFAARISNLLRILPPVLAWQTEIRARVSSNMDSKAARGISAELRSSWRAFTIQILHWIKSSVYCPIIKKELQNFSNASHSAHN